MGALPNSFVGPSVAYSSRFRVGGVSVQVGGSNGDDIALVPSLEPFRIEAGASEIDIQVERAARLPLLSGRELFDSGSVWRLYEDEGRFQFDFRTPFFGESPYKRLIVDREFRQANLLLRDECFAYVDRVVAPLDYPLDEVLIMHRLALEEAIELHGCGVIGPNGANNLFVGHSGAGKSTTARLWVSLTGVEVLSDDRIILRRDSGGSGMGAPCGAASTEEREGIVRLRGCSASRTSHSAQDDRARTAGGIRMYGTPWHGEAAFASPGTAPLSRIFVLEHGRGNALTRLCPSQAVAQLFARSFVPFHRHEYVNSALEFLQDVVNVVPCYRYTFEPDERAVERILNFHD